MAHESGAGQAIEALERADVDAGARAARDRDQPHVKAAGALGKLGDQEPLYAISAALFFAGLVARRRDLTRAGLHIGLGVAFADLAKSALKASVARTRPKELIDRGHYEVSAGGSDAKREQSFPSGHMACTTAAALGLARVWPASLPLGLLASGGLGWSRVAKGVHWPLDVAVGALIGAAATAAARLVLGRADG